MLSILIAGSGLLSSNPGLTVACATAFLALVLLLWRPGEPPALLLVGTLQWVQVAGKVLHADAHGVPVWQTSFAGHGEEAVWLSLLALVFLGFGMRLGVGRLRLESLSNVDQQLRNVSLDRVFALYLPLAVFSVAVSATWGSLLAIAQVLMVLGWLKWVLFYLLAYLSLRWRKKRHYLVIATVIEFVAGIGYFAEFKGVFYVLTLVVLSLRFRLTLRTTLIAAAALVAFILSALAWTGIKGDYRAYISGRGNNRAIFSSTWDAATTFVGMLTNLDPHNLSAEAELLASRVEYTDFFGAVLDYVPRRRPHERGALLLNSVTHVLIPRALYPDKPILGSDSDETERYTGLAIAGSEQETSISMGYVAEMYIDFGRYGMYLVVLAFGCLWGLMYRYFVTHAPARAVGYAFGTALLTHVGSFEIAESKLLGGMVAGFLVLALTLRYAAPPAFRWLSATGRSTNQRLGASLPNQLLP
jgi:hypothetical protein